MSKIEKALKKAQDERTLETNTAQVVKLVQTVPHESAYNLSAHAGRSLTTVEKTSTEHFEAQRLLSSNSNQAVKDYINVIRTQLLQKTRSEGWNTIMVTSPRKGEGKTTVAANLALSIAKDARQTALLVDANLRNPSVAQTFGLQSQQGLLDILLEQAELPEALINPGIDKLVVLSAGSAIEESADIIGAPIMESLVQELKSRYSDRYVLFDCPHILDMPDSMLFSTYVDAVLLVVEEAKTSERDIRSALEMLGHTNVIGLILNKNQVR